ncbi:acyl-CoA thioesterase [Gallibacterium trehalosifermentans]|uniref:Acyl-CoA thioesterase n=1 Tax=Gallibacterium trehalosifermentans TaxID=516935 RepID=A0ABV6H082_9PAST
MSAKQPALISVRVACQPAFQDLDIMQVVWHGRYWQFIEQAREALFNHIGYGYAEMIKRGYQFPIIKAEIKYIQPIVLDQQFDVEAALLEYENRVHIRFTFFDKQSQKILCKASSMQAVVAVGERHLQFVTPDCFQQKVRSFLAN